MSWNSAGDWSVFDGINVPTGTLFPNASGIALGEYHHISLTGSLIDGVGETTVLTVEATNDENPTTANWVTIYGYDSRVHLWVNLQTITNGTLVFAWDFDYVNYKYARLRIVTTAATNTVIIKARGRT